MEQWVAIFVLGVLVLYVVLRLIVLIHSVRLQGKEQKEQDQDQDTPPSP